MARAIFPSLFVLVFVLLSTAVASDSPDMHHLEAIAKMSEKDKLSVVLAALRFREAELTSFEFTLDYAVANFESVKAPGPGKPLWKQTVTVRRSGDRVLFHGHEFAPDGTSKREWINNWDGASRRELILPNSANEAYQGSISDTESSNLCGLTYNNLLGYRVPLAPLTLSQWLDRAAGDGTLQQIRPVEKNGRATIEIHVLVPPVTHKWYWLDVDRKFMPIEYEHRDTDGTRTFDWGTQHVAEAKLIDGIWVPMKVVRRSGNVKPRFTEYVYTIASFVRRKISDEEMRVEFPVGTEVVDRIENTAFKITATQEKQYTPLYHTATGLVTVGKQTQSELLGHAIDPFSNKRTRGLWLGVTTGVAALSFVIIWQLRRRRYRGT